MHKKTLSEGLRYLACGGCQIPGEAEKRIFFHPRHADCFQFSIESDIIDDGNIKYVIYKNISAEHNQENARYRGKQKKGFFSILSFGISGILFLMVYTLSAGYPRRAL